ncbi:hypothetical protein MTR67_023056, partial [Solanum verrucosum]
SLGLVNKGVVDQLVLGGIMQQPYKITSHLLDGMAKINRACGSKSVKVVGIDGENPNEAHFEALYNEEVNFPANQGGGFRPSYPWPGGNSGWNRDDGETDRDRELHDRNATWQERDGDKDRYVPPHECRNLKEQRANPENFHTKDMLAHFLNKGNSLLPSFCNFRHKRVVDVILNGKRHHLANFGQIEGSMERPKVAGKNQPPLKRACGITINEEAIASQALAAKLLQREEKARARHPWI